MKYALPVTRPLHRAEARKQRRADLAWLSKQIRALQKTQRKLTATPLPTTGTRYEDVDENDPRLAEALKNHELVGEWRVVAENLGEAP